MGVLAASAERTPAIRRLGVTVPIFGFAHDIATVAAISNAGGLGVYGATRRFPHEITAELAELRRLVGTGLSALILFCRTACPNTTTGPRSSGTSRPVIEPLSKT